MNGSNAVADRPGGSGTGGLWPALGRILMHIPGPPVDTTLRPLALPADLRELDAYLARAEARCDDIRPGAHRRVAWAPPVDRERTEISIVYLHGFSSGPEEIRPVCDRVAARLGANLHYPRLAGHGRTGEAMLEATANALLNAALAALEVGRRLGRRVLLVGTSTGAALATWLALTRPADVLLGMVLLSPNFGLRDRRTEILRWGWGRALAERVQGPWCRFPPVNERHARHWTTGYPTRALGEMMALVGLVRRLDLARNTVPALVLYARGDRIVDPSEIERRFARLGGAGNALVEITGADDPKQHVLAGDALSPSTTGAVVDRICAFAAERRGT